MVLWRLFSKTYLSGATLTGGESLACALGLFRCFSCFLRCRSPPDDLAPAVGILAPNLYNSHKFVMHSFQNDGPVESVVTAFTYTWLATVKAFGAGLVWPLTIMDGLERQRVNPDSLKLYWTLDREYDFIRDNAHLARVIKNGNNKK